MNLDFLKRKKSEKKKEKKKETVYSKNISLYIELGASTAEYFDKSPIVMSQ